MNNSPEIWKTIPETAGLYEASNLGRIRRKYYSRPPKIRALRYKIGTRYLRVALFLQGSSIHRSVHRLVCEAFHGPSNGREVDHLNSIADDNRPENLEWVTRSENTKRSYERGYRKIVSKETKEKMKQAQILRRLREQG